MSRGDASGHIESLRQTIALIEGGGAYAPGFAAGGMARRVALGRGLALDRMLGGGLRRDQLSEVVAGGARHAGAASGFALALAARFAAAHAGPVVWIMEDGARSETGVPHAPGLAAHGLDPARLVVVRTGSGADSLWAMEEALRCRGVAAVVLDLWRTRFYDLVASRRLVLAAAAGGTPGILVPAGAPGSARVLSSAAQVRFEVGAAPGTTVPPQSSTTPRVRPGPRRHAGTLVPLPGRAAWAVRLARVRAGPVGVDWDKIWPLVWDHEEAWLCDALPVPPPALAGDRPHPAAHAGRGG